MIIRKYKEGEMIWQRRYPGRSASDACRRQIQRLEAQGHFTESGYDGQRGRCPPCFWIIVSAGDNCLRFISEPDDSDQQELARMRAWKPSVA